MDGLAAEMVGEVDFTFGNVGSDKERSLTYCRLACRYDMFHDVSFSSTDSPCLYRAAQSTVRDYRNRTRNRETQAVTRADENRPRFFRAFPAPSPAGGRQQGMSGIGRVLCLPCSPLL